jgi:hypothetical protein
MMVTRFIKMSDQKCVVEEQGGSRPICTTHGSPLENRYATISEFAPFGQPNPAIEELWRCPKGGSVILQRLPQ